MSGKLRIGYINPAYPVSRNILNKCRDVEYVRIRPYLAMREKVGRYFPSIRPRHEESYVYEGGVTWPPFQKYDLCHFFNNISICRQGKPYLTTFEDTIPRSVKSGSDIWKRCIESMQSDRCRRLIALSECALHRQRLYCQKYAVDGLESKMLVLLPPQDLLADEGYLISKWNITTKRQIKFAFVGQGFWRKGGGETVRALARVRKHYPIQLFLVGNVDSDDYLQCPTIDRKDEMHRLIAANKDWIEYHQNLPNGDVLKKFKDCDVGLLPTRGDTFGFSVLEMQACGLPCITTSCWALPEINNDACGWLLDVPREIGRNVQFSTVDEYVTKTKLIEDQLYEICMKIADDASVVVTKGRAAIRRISKDHDPKRFGGKLRQIYDGAL